MTGQVQHYTDTISKRTDWDLVDIYADDGISGTTTTKRTEFLRMINECMAGKIDMIITKSISRFARNTEDCLHFVRKLKDKGIAVYFETENIDTLGSGGELLLTILSGMAQRTHPALPHVRGQNRRCGHHLCKYHGFQSVGGRATQNEIGFGTTHC